MIAVEDGTAAARADALRAGRFAVDLASVGFAAAVDTLAHWLASSISCSSSYVAHCSLSPRHPGAPIGGRVPKGCPNGQQLERVGQ